MASSFADQWFEFGRDAWLIAYDIADPVRLGCVHRYLKSVAIPVQYSVFLGWFPERELALLVRGLNLRIDPRRDDVRLYHLPSRTQLYRFGRQWLPDQVRLVGDTWSIDGAATIGSEEEEQVGDHLRNTLPRWGKFSRAD